MFRFAVGDVCEANANPIVSISPSSCTEGIQPFSVPMGCTVFLRVVSGRLFAPEPCSDCVSESLCAMCALVQRTPFAWVPCAPVVGFYVPKKVIPMIRPNAFHRILYSLHVFSVSCSSSHGCIVCTAVFALLSITIVASISSARCVCVSEAAPFGVCPTICTVLVPSLGHHCCMRVPARLTSSTSCIVFQVNNRSICNLEL